MILTWTWLTPLLLLLPHPSTTQAPQVSSAPKRDVVCLAEILISTPQPSDSAQLDDANQRAYAAREAIRQGARFEDVAKKYSDGPTATYGGALGSFKRGQLSKQIEDKVFAMEVGDVTDVIRSKQGFIVLRVTDCSTARYRGSGPGTPAILTDTRGVDFGPYIERVRQIVPPNWYRIIPKSVSTRKGEVSIEFSIMKDGSVADVRVAGTSGDADLDRAALDSVTKSSPLPPLPTQFTGPLVRLRVHFAYNEDKVE